MQIEYKRLEELIPYDKNPRKNDKAVDMVMASIKEFGFKNPIIIDRDNVIIAGHTRLKAAKKLKLKEVPTIQADDLTEEQVRAFRIADNKTAEGAEWDMSLLLEELNELKAMDYDTDLTGFNINQVSGMFDEKEAEDDNFDIVLPEVPETKPGDIWQLGKHRLMCGDSTSEETVYKLMNGELADMVFTDPPWNVDYGNVEKGNKQGYKPRTIMNDSMSTASFKDFMDGAFSCMNKASKCGAMTYVVMSAQEWGNMMLSLYEHEYHWSSTIIWNKDRLVLSRKDYHTKYEPIWYGWKDGAARICPLSDRKQSDVWDFERPRKSEEHPTMKPVELVAHAIKNSSLPNTNILDLFGGSGTTLIASEQLGRKCFMMELDPKYCDVVKNRWEALTGEKATKE